MLGLGGRMNMVKWYTPSGRLRKYMNSPSIESGSEDHEPWNDR
jgi:hypothetical protein